MRVSTSNFISRRRHQLHVVGLCNRFISLVRVTDVKLLNVESEISKQNWLSIPFWNFTQFSFPSAVQPNFSVITSTKDVMFLPLCVFMSVRGITQKMSTNFDKKNFWTGGMCDCHELIEFCDDQITMRNFYRKQQKKRSEETQILRVGCSAEPKKFRPAADPFPGARDGQNLISWRRSLPLPTNPVWWGSIHAISSYRGNRPPHSPTHTHKHTNRQDRLQYTAPQLPLQCRDNAECA